MWKDNLKISLQGLQELKWRWWTLKTRASSGVENVIWGQVKAQILKLWVTSNQEFKDVFRKSPPVSGWMYAIA